MENTEKNEIAITKYRNLATHSYREPVDGRLEDVTGTLLKQLNDSEIPHDKSDSEIETEINETDDVCVFVCNY